MEKSVLQRLFGFFRDLSDQRKAAPPSPVGLHEGGKPRLTAIEGGKGKTGWDGNERRKPAAVIGIPYSSDIADGTMEEKGSDESLRRDKRQ